MGRSHSTKLAEAENLLAEVASWTDTELTALPPLYQEKAREYRRLVNGGEKTETTTL
jgi:hypothetical protein